MQNIFFRRRLSIWRSLACDEILDSFIAYNITDSDPDPLILTPYFTADTHQLLWLRLCSSAFRTYDVSRSLKLRLLECRKDREHY